MSRSSLLVAATAAGALLIPAVADAHVTLQPNEVPAGAYKRIDVRVPNETDDQTTTKVAVKFPAGFSFASYQPVPGWTVKVTKTKLATPVKTDDGEITEGISQVTWTADSTKDGVPPGAFQDFGLSVLTPEKPGTTLTFPAVQTYTGGEVVRWIGAPDGEHPAPTVKLTAAAGDHHAAAAAVPATKVAAEPEDDDDAPSTGLVIGALILGGLGLLTGVIALVAARRRPA